MDIPGYESLYWLDTVGNVFSVKRNIFMKPVKINGYIRVGLTKNNKEKKYLVHRLVAMTYLDNPDNLPCVNHKNCIRDDNRVENLEWCSNLYNNQSKNTIRSVGCIRKHKNKYHFKIHIYKKILFYNCPSLHIAEAMRQVFVDLL